MCFKTMGMCYIRVSGIDDLYNDIKNTGVQFSGNKEPQIMPWGQKEFSIIDNNHNLLTFGEDAS